MATSATARRGRTQPNLALVRARLNKKLSRADVARLTGITDKQIGLIERGCVRPHDRTMFAIADAMEVDVLDLFPVEGLVR